MTPQEMMQLKKLWNTIAPNEPNGYDCSCQEQRDYNAHHADFYFYGAGDGYVIVDLVEWREDKELDYPAYMRQQDEINRQKVEERYG